MRKKIECNQFHSYNSVYRHLVTFLFFAVLIILSSVIVKATDDFEDSILDRAKWSNYSVNASYCDADHKTWSWDERDGFLEMATSSEGCAGTSAVTSTLRSLFNLNSTSQNYVINITFNFTGVIATAGNYMMMIDFYNSTNITTYGGANLSAITLFYRQDADLPTTNFSINLFSNGSAILYNEDMTFNTSANVTDLGRGQGLYFGVRTSSAETSFTTTSILKVLDISIMPYIEPKAVDIFIPAFNNTHFNYNSSIPLNFSVTDTGMGISSCNYSIINSTGEEIIENTDILNCENTSFNISGQNGEYNLTFCANDTLNRWSCSMYSFYSDVVFPSIYINYLHQVGTSQDIIFNATSSDMSDYNCSYTIFNMAGGVDGLNNATIPCNMRKTASVSAYASYNIYIYATDLAGNQASANQTFVMNSAGTGGGFISGIGGGGGSFLPWLQNQTRPNICMPFEVAFNRCFNENQEENLLNKIIICYKSFFDFIFCKSSASIVPI